MKSLGAFKEAHNLLSENYNPCANQFEIEFENGIAFQSYRSLMAVLKDGRLYLTDRHDYSRTTAKHCTHWTNLTTTERRKGLETGEITLIV